MQYIYQYVITFLSFLAIDSIWLTTMAPRFYRKYIGHLMADKPDLLSAGLFYAIYIVGILYFIIQPALKGDWSLGKVLFSGALFGVIAYATFDLTNQAVLKDWSKIVTLVDMIWGGVLTGSVSILAFSLIKKFL